MAKYYHRIYLLSVRDQFDLDLTYANDSAAFESNNKNGRNGFYIFAKKNMKRTNLATIWVARVD